MKKKRIGIVIKNSTNKTIIVKEIKRKTHSRYLKKIFKTKKYYVHDEKNEYKKGDIVKILETKPISKTKHWIVIKK